MYYPCFSFHLPEDGGVSSDREKDENGNPFESGDRNSGSANNGTKWQGFPHGPNKPYKLQSRDPLKSSDDKDMFPGAFDQKQPKSKHQKKQDKEQAKVVKAELIPGHIGDKPVEEILSFINNKTNSSGSSPAASSGGKNATKNGPLSVAAKKSSSSSGKQQTNNRKERLSSSELSSPPPSSVLTDSVCDVQCEGRDGGEPNQIIDATQKGRKKKKPKNSTSINKDESRSGVPDMEDRPAPKVDISDPSERHTNTSTAASSSKDEIGAKSHVKVQPGSNSGIFNHAEASPLTDNFQEYIFTDFDSVAQPKEEQFQTVTKRKKKHSSGIPETNNPVRPAGASSYVRDTTVPDKEVMTSRTFPDSRKDDFPFRPRRYPPPPRSFTPPPTPARGAGTTDQDMVIPRDLSPSSFPVLGTSSREGRRNSTGNAPSDLGNDDSDLESVKSVPLMTSSIATGLKKVPSGTTMSSASSTASSSASGRPRPISYASIAAGGGKPSSAKGFCADTQGIDYAESRAADRGAVNLASPGENGTVGDTAQSPPSGSLLEADSLTKVTSSSSVSSPDAATTSSATAVSGSVTRLSITSSAGTNLAIDTSKASAAAATKQKVPTAQGGSQHGATNIRNSAVDSAESTKNTGISRGMVSTPDAHVEKVLAPDAGSHGRYSQPTVVNSTGPQAAHNFAQQQATSPPIPRADLQETKLSMSASASSLASSDNAEIAAKESNVDTFLPQPHHHHHRNRVERDPVNVVRAVDSPSGPQTKVIPPRTRTNGNNNRLGRSVVFLDRRMNESPQNLGISFGFMPELDQGNEPQTAALVCQDIIPAAADIDSAAGITFQASPNDNIIMHEDSCERTFEFTGDDNDPNVVDSRCECVNPVSKLVNAVEEIARESASSGSSSCDCPGNNSTAVNQSKTRVAAEQIAPPNGIVLPPGKQLEIVTNSSKTHEMTHRETDDNDNKINRATVEDEACLGTSDTDSQKVAYDRTTDPNFDIGKFNVESVVAFLYTGK